MDVLPSEKWKYYLQKSGHITLRAYSLLPLCLGAVVRGSILRLQVLGPLSDSFLESITRRADYIPKPIKKDVAF